MSHPNHFTGGNLPTEGYPPFAGQPPLYAAAGVPPFMGAHPTQQVLLPPAQSLPPGTAVLQQPFPGPQGPQKDKLESALDFLEQVKAVFENRLEVYNQFLDIMKEFKAHSIDTPGVIARVKELFKGHPKLVFGFNTFLPPGYKIDLAEVEAEEEQRKRQEQQKREASATKGEAWDAQSAAAQKKYPEEFDQARNYVRKIKVRFEYQPHIYKAFLEILHTYHNKQHTIQEVYQQVARLFKDNPDLLEEFKQFLPDPANQKRETAAPASQPVAAAAVPNNNLQGPRGRSTRSNPPRSAIANQTAAASETSRRPTRERSTRGDDASKSRIDGSYGTFTEHSYFFRIKSYLGPKRYPEFLKCLTLFNQEIITKYELVLLARDLLRGEYELLNWFKEFVGLEDEELSEDEGGFSLAELDLSNSEQCTPSYRALPEKYRVAKCSGRTRLCASVLNDTWISVPIGSEDGTFKNSRKNQYEELLFKCEDDRYEFDLLIENNTSTIKALESLLRKIKTLAPEEVNSYELTDKDELEQLQYKSIKKVYGTRGKEMVDSLKKYPAVAIPVVLARLKQKDIEWSKAKREWNKVWRQINERNYHKSLDHMGSFFKQDEKKFLSPKTLLQDVAKAMDPISPMPSQLNFEFKHAHIFDDIKRLMQVTFEKSIGRSDREKADKLVKQVFSELFSLNPHRVEDSASDVKPLNTAGTSSTNTSRVVFLGNDNQYLLFRYIQVLYQRLERAREMSSIPLNQSGNWSVMKDVENGTTSNIVSIKTDERMEVDSTRELAVGTTMLSNVPVVQPLDEEQTMQRYNKFMDELVKLISGAVEQGQFEDEARLALGTGSFMLFTLDKVVGYLCKQVHVVLGDQQSDQLLGLYNYEFARTQEGSANEQVYINNAAQLLQNGRCYLFAFEVNSSVLHLTIEYIALESGKATKVDAKPLPSNDNSGAGSGAGNNNNSTGSSNNGNAPSGPGNSSPNSSGGNSSPSGNGSMPPASTLSYNARELEQWSRYTNQLLLADHPHHIITHLFLNRNLKKNKKNMDKVFANIQVHNDLSSMIDVRTLKTRYVEHTEDWFYRPKSAARAARAGTNKRSFSPSLFNKMKS